MFISKKYLVLQYVVRYWSILYCEYRIEQKQNAECGVRLVLDDGCNKPTVQSYQMSSYRVPGTGYLVPGTSTWYLVLVLLGS